MPASVKARVTRATCSTDTPFFISLSRRSEATSSPPEIAMQPLSASCWHNSGLNDFSKRMLPHHEIDELRVLQLGGERLQRLGRRGLVDEMKAGLAGLATIASMRSTSVAADAPS